MFFPRLPRIPSKDEDHEGHDDAEQFDEGVEEQVVLLFWWLVDNGSLANVSSAPRGMRPHYISGDSFVLPIMRPQKTCEKNFSFR